MSCRAGAGAAPFFTAPAKKGGSGSTTLETSTSFISLFCNTSCILIRFLHADPDPRGLPLCGYGFETLLVGFPNNLYGFYLLVPIFRVLFVCRQPVEKCQHRNHLRGEKLASLLSSPFSSSDNLCWGSGSVAGSKLEPY